jgi:hypothetical protein
LPATNPLFYEQKMDAAWGRGKFRSEIWEDKVNPKNDWWTAYLPSQEEIQASKAGFDFKDPESWCKENNIDYEKAKAAGKEVSMQQLEEVCIELILHVYSHMHANILFDDYIQMRKNVKPFSMEEFKSAQKEYFEMQKRFFEFAFRLDDDERQIAKGQPSLNDEDTGYQWKNDVE